MELCATGCLSQRCQWSLPGKPKSPLHTSKRVSKLSTTNNGKNLWRIISSWHGRSRDLRVNDNKLPTSSSWLRACYYTIKLSILLREFDVSFKPLLEARVRRLITKLATWLGGRVTCCTIQRGKVWSPPVFKYMGSYCYRHEQVKSIHVWWLFKGPPESWERIATEYYAWPWWGLSRSLRWKSRWYKGASGGINHFVHLIIPSCLPH